jgi:hypothetical protein
LDRSRRQSRRCSIIGSGLASAGGQTNPLVLSLSKDEPWDARGSTGSPRAWEPISARSSLAARGESPASHRDERGAPPARRDD